MNWSWLKGCPEGPRIRVGSGRVNQAVKVVLGMTKQKGQGCMMRCV